MFPAGTMEVGYSGFGPTIGLNGTLRCINQENFVQSIDLKIIKHKDDSKHCFHWTVFRSQKLTLKGEEAELELPYSFMINISQPKRYNILFADMNTRDEMQAVLRNVYKEWETSLQKFVSLGTLDSILMNKKYYEEFSTSKVHVDAFAALDRMCYWESGEYSVELKIYTPKRTFVEKWKFGLTEEYTSLIRLNAIKILQDTCRVQTVSQYNFAYPKYE